MAKTPAFADILDKPIKMTERPKPLPPGQYIWAVVGLPREDVSKNKGTPYIEFTAKCLGPVNENTVDPDALEEWKANLDGTKKNIQDETQRLTFYKVEKAMFMLQRFLGHLGFDEQDDATYKQIIAETPGQTFIGTVKHKNFQSGGGQYAYIDSTAPVSE